MPDTFEKIVIGLIILVGLAGAYLGVTSVNNYLMSRETMASIEKFAGSLDCDEDERYHLEIEVENQGPQDLRIVRTTLSVYRDNFILARSDETLDEPVDFPRGERILMRIKATPSQSCVLEADIKGSVGLYLEMPSRHLPFPFTTTVEVGERQ